MKKKLLWIISLNIFLFSNAMAMEQEEKRQPTIRIKSIIVDPSAQQFFKDGGKLHIEYNKGRPAKVIRRSSYPGLISQEVIDCELEIQGIGSHDLCVRNGSASVANTEANISQADENEFVIMVSKYIPGAGTQAWQRGHIHISVANITEGEIAERYSTYWEAGTP